MSSAQAVDGTTGGPAAGPAWRVRRAELRDVPEMDAMIHELAAYEKAPELVEATPQDLQHALFGAGSADGTDATDGTGSAGPRVHAHVAEIEVDGEWAVAGIAVWFLTYSTWTGRHGLWLEDLFVRPASRGLGLGKALLAALAAECVERGYRRLEWWVLDWNTPAQGVYRSVGAAPQQGWTTWRLDGEGLGQLANRVDAGSPGLGTVDG